jgi:hypothetical protein
MCACTPTLARDEARRRRARLAKPNRAPAGNTATVKSRRAFEPPAFGVNGTVQTFSLDRCSRSISKAGISHSGFRAGALAISRAPHPSARQRRSRPPPIAMGKKDETPEEKAARKEKEKKGATRERTARRSARRRRQARFRPHRGSRRQTARTAPDLHPSCARTRPTDADAHSTIPSRSTSQRRRRRRRRRRSPTRPPRSARRGKPRRRRRRRRRLPPMRPRSASLRAARPPC